MKPLSQQNRANWFQLSIVLLLAIALSGCGKATPPSVQILNTTPPLADTPTAITVSITQSVQVVDPTPVVVEAGERTATPVVWINKSTNLPSIEALPVFPTFTVTSTPTITSTPTKGPLPHLTHTQTASPTITATSQPPGAPLSIIQPGLSSKILSPYEIEATIRRGADKMVYLYLIGEGQVTYYSEVLDFRWSAFERLRITPTLVFSIPTVAETARLILQTFDEQGRIWALSSVDLILLSIGKNEVNPAQHPYQPFVIDSPDEWDEVTGNSLIVSGRAAPINMTPVIIELVDETGAVLASREILLMPSIGVETYTPFVIELNYSVTQPTQARLSIRQESDNRIPGTIALSSIAVTLLP